MGYLQGEEELNSSPPKENPSCGSEEDLKPGPPDYKSSTLPLGHAHLQKIKPGQPRGMALTIFFPFLNPYNREGKWAIN